VRALLSAFLALVGLLLAEPAWAQSAAAAQALFDDGKRLLAEGDYAKARDAFAESQRLDPGLGTLFQLATCEEKLGRTATAWATFLDVAMEAHARGSIARERVARDRAASLEPGLAKLVVATDAVKDTPGVEVTRDGALVGRPQWATAVPVDPGSHLISASAPGKIAWTTTVVVQPRAVAQVAIPPLLDAAPTPAPPVTTTSADLERVPSGRGNAQRAVGFVLGAAGLAGLGVGGYFGVLSLVRHDQAQPHCGAATCDATGVALRNDAYQAGNVATIGLVAGGAVLLGGIIVVATAPHDSSSASARPSSSFALTLGPAGGGVSGTW
jgi:hypothetical protein